MFLWLLDSQNVNTRECNSSYWLARDLCIPNMHIWLTFIVDIKFNRQLFSIHTVFRTVHFASIFRQTTFLPHFIFSTPFFPYFNCCPRQSRLSVNWCENMPYGIMKNGPKYRWKLNIRSGRRFFFSFLVSHNFIFSLSNIVLNLFFGGKCQKELNNRKTHDAIQWTKTAAAAVDDTREKENILKAFKASLLR